MAAPGIVGTAKGGITGSGSFTVTPPPGAASYWAVAIWYGALGDIAPPAGWTAVESGTIESTWANYAFYRSSSATPGSSWTHNNATESMSVAMVGYSTPSDADVSAGTNNTLISPTVTTTTITELLRVIVNQPGTTGTTMGFPSNAPNAQVMQVTSNGPENYFAAMASSTQTSAGASGTATWTASTAWGYRAMTYGIMTTPQSPAWASAGAVAYSAASGTSVVPAYPASIASGDLLLATVAQKPGTNNSGTVSTPTGWSLVGTSTWGGGYGTSLGADTGNTRIYVYSRIADGTETGSLTITIGTNNVSWAQIYRLTRSGGSGWDIALASSTRDTAPTSGTAFTMQMTTNPGVTWGDLLIGIMSVPTDIQSGALFSAGSFSATGATIGSATEVAEAFTTNGNDLGGVVYRASVTSGTGTANPNLILTAVSATMTNVRGPSSIIRVRVVEGAAYESLPADTVGITDSATTALSREKSLAESVGMADATTKVLDSVRTPSDSVGLTDAVSVVYSISRDQTDTIGLTDNINVTLTSDSSQIIGDAVGISDAVTTEVSSSKDVSDAAILSDAISSETTRPRDITDTVGLTDSVSAVLGISAEQNDAIGLTDAITISRDLSTTQTDSVGITDAITTEFTAGPTEPGAIPGVVGTVTGGTATSGNFTVTPTPGASSYIALVQWYGLATAITAPTGWTVIDTGRFGPDEFTNYALYSADSSPGTIWNYSGATYGASVTIVGYNTTVTISVSNAVNSVQSGTPTSPAIDTTAESLILRTLWRQSYDAAATVTYPTGHTIGQAQSNQLAGGEYFTTAVAHAEQTSIGSTGTAAWAATGTQWYSRSGTYSLTGAAGTDYTDVISDSVGISDNIIVEFTGSGEKLIGDSIGLTDSVQVTRTISRTVSDSIGITDNASVPGYKFGKSLSSNRRYLVDQTGNPWPMKMTSPWGWVAHYNLSEWTAYFENIAAKGFNATLFEVIATANGGGGVNDDGRNYAGQLPFTGGNITQLNSTYWNHIVAIVDAANAVGITPILSVIDGWALDPIFTGKSQADCQSYGNQVATLMNGKHVLWHFGGDYAPITNEPWNGATTDLQMRACLTGIRAAGHNEAFTIQLNYEYSFSQQNQFWERELGGNSGDGWSFVYTYWATYAGVYEAYNWTTQANQWSGERNPRPSIFSESNYWGENIGGGAQATEPTTQETIRRQVGWAVTHGSPGFGYGDDNWDGSGPSYSHLLNDAPPTQVNQLANRVFGKTGWHLLQPDITLVTAGAGTRRVGAFAEDVLENDYVTAAKTPTGSLAVIYVPSNSSNTARTITVDLSKLGSNPTAVWYDPTTNTTQSAGSGPTYTTPATHADGTRDYLLEITATDNSVSGSVSDIIPIIVDATSIAVSNTVSVGSAIPLLTESIVASATNAATLSETLALLIESTNVAVGVSSTAGETIPTITEQIGISTHNTATVGENIPQLTGLTQVLVEVTLSLNETIPSITENIGSESSITSSAADIIPLLIENLQISSSISTSAEELLPQLTESILGSTTNEASVADSIDLITESMLVVIGNVVAAIFEEKIPELFEEAIGTVEYSGSLDEALPGLTESVSISFDVITTAQESLPGLVENALTQLTVSIIVAESLPGLEESINTSSTSYISASETIPLFTESIGVQAVSDVAAQIQENLPMLLESILANRETNYTYNIQIVMWTSTEFVDILSVTGTEMLYWNGLSF